MSAHKEPVWGSDCGEILLSGHELTAHTETVEMGKGQKAQGIATT